LTLSSWFFRLWFLAPPTSARMLRFARFGLPPVQRPAEEEFSGQGAVLLLKGAPSTPTLPPTACSRDCRRRCVH
jgi:hypothetical protein